MIDIFGYLAGTLCTISFIPQAYKCIVEKNVEGISLMMYIIFSVGVLLWFIYGIILGNLPIIIFNALTLILAIAILINILKHSKKKPK